MDNMSLTVTFLDGTKILIDFTEGTEPLVLRDQSGEAKTADIEAVATRIMVTALAQSYRTHGTTPHGPHGG